MMGLEHDNQAKATNFEQHEVEIPVLVLEQVLVVSILSKHGEFGFRLDLLCCDLDFPEHRTYLVNVIIGRCQVFLSAEHVNLRNFIHGRGSLLISCSWSTNLNTSAIRLDIVLDLFFFLFVGMKSERHSQINPRLHVREDNGVLAWNCRIEQQDSLC